MNEEIYNLLAETIINNDISNQDLLFDKKFEFCSDYEECRYLSIGLTKKEFENKKLGIYNAKTEKLKELEYIYCIKNNNIIKPFKTTTEKTLFLNAIKQIKQISKLGLKKDLKNSFKEFKKEIIIAEHIFLPIAFFLGMYSIKTGSFLDFIFSLIIASFPIIPTLYLSYFTEKSLNRENRKLNKERANEALKYINILSKKIDLLPSKETMFIEAKTDSKCEKNIQDSVLNEISNLIELLSNSNLDRQTIQNYLSKIKSIKEAYASRLSQINELSVDNEYTIKGYFIQEIAKLEYEINASIIQNKETIQNQTESKLIDAKIHSLQQRTKNR